MFIYLETRPQSHHFRRRGEAPDAHGFARMMARNGLRVGTSPTDIGPDASTASLNIVIPDLSSPTRPVMRGDYTPAKRSFWQRFLRR